MAEGSWIRGDGVRSTWVSVEELRREGHDLSDKEYLIVRFPNGWWCKRPPGDAGRFVPDGLTRPDPDRPVMSWSGKFYPKYNPSDERTVFDGEFPGTWLSRLPKRAQVNMGKSWATEKEERRAKREDPRAPATLQELRSHGNVTQVDHAKARVAEEERIEALVQERLAAIEAEKKEAARARMAKAREAKQAKTKKD